MGTHPIFESDFDCLTDGLYIWTNNSTWRTQHQPRVQVFAEDLAAEDAVVAVHVVEAVVANAVVAARANPRSGNQSLNWVDLSRMVKSSLWKKSTPSPSQSRNSKLSIISLPTIEGRSLEDQASPETNPCRSTYQIQ